MKAQMTKWEFINAAMKQERVGYDIALYYWKIYSKQIKP